MKLANSLLNFFTSLRLTVACLLMALALVFIGTVAQVKYGLYTVQADFFQSLFVYWRPGTGSIRIPVWPGGYLLGTVLLLNLVAAHIKRFEFSAKKAGIFMTHIGIILMLVGQLATQIFQVESAMRIPEGESRNYSESPRFSELAVIDKTDPQKDHVVAIPEKMLASGEISDPKLPFKLRVKNFYQNSKPYMERGQREVFFQPKDRATSMNDKDVPTATVEVVTDEGTKGPFTLSNWKSEVYLVGALREDFGSLLPQDFAEPAKVTVKGHQYELAMRPVRYYKPFAIELLKFSHDKYAGTDVAKNFSSRVRITRPETGENRETLIYMNNPLRYGGETYYQGSFEKGDMVTILQVVRNPNWITPYVACGLVFIGLSYQFLWHLAGFARKRAKVIPA